MKIALLKGKQKEIGGLEKWTRLIADSFLAKGHDVTLLTTGKKASIPTVTFHCPTWPSFYFLNQFDQMVSHWVKENTPDIVFGLDRNRFQTHLRAGNGVHASFLESRILSEGKAKYHLCQINPLHRTILSMEKTAFEHEGLRKIFVNSHMVKQEILHFYKVDEKKIEVIHNGVDLESGQIAFHTWEEKRKEFFQKENIDPDKLHLLFVGNGFKRKGLDPLLESLQEKDVFLSIVGTDKNSLAYKEKVKKLGLENKVRFFGLQKNIFPFYQMADALVIPSFYDPFANVTIEALSMGLSVITTKKNGGHEVISNSSGIILENNNPEELKDAFKKIGVTTKEKRELIRNSVSHLTVEKQLKSMMEKCLPTY